MSAIPYYQRLLNSHFSEIKKNMCEDGGGWMGGEERGGREEGKNMVVCLQKFTLINIFFFN